MSDLKDAITVVKHTPDLLTEAVKALYRDVPDPCGLMPQNKFTLRELRTLHESVLGEDLTKSGFDRRMSRHVMLEPTGEMARGVVGKPAKYYRKTVAKLF